MGVILKKVIKKIIVIHAYIFFNSSVILKKNNCLQHYSVSYFCYNEYFHRHNKFIIQLKEKQIGGHINYIFHKLFTENVCMNSYLLN